MYVRRNVLCDTVRLAKSDLHGEVEFRGDGEEVWKARSGKAEGLVNCCDTCLRAAGMANGRLRAKAILLRYCVPK